MRHSYLLLLSGLLLPGTVVAQATAAPVVSFSAVQPGHYYLGLSLGTPVYWAERLYQLSPLQSDAYRAIAVPTLWVGRQFTAHWAGQVGLNGYVVPTASVSGQYTIYRSSGSVTINSQEAFGATVAALPLLARYNPRWSMGFDTILEGWLGLTPVWQRVQYDEQEYQNGLLTYDEHQHGQLVALYPAAGLSLGFGVWQGIEILLDGGMTARLRLAGYEPASPTWSGLVSLSMRYQLGGRVHRLRYHIDD